MCLSVISQGNEHYSSCGANKDETWHDIGPGDIALYVAAWSVEIPVEVGGGGFVGGGGDGREGGETHLADYQNV